MASENSLANARPIANLSDKSLSKEPLQTISSNI